MAEKTTLRRGRTQCANSKDVPKPSMLRDMARHPLYGLGALVLPSTPLWFIGQALGAKDTLTILLCLPLGITSIAFFLCIPSIAKGDEDTGGNAKIPKIAYIGCLVAALLAFLFLFLPAARDLSASVNPPVTELSRLSAEFRKGDSSMELWASSDEWKLSGVDSDGIERELVIDEDDWWRLAKVGRTHDVAWDESRIEFDAGTRIVGHWLPGSSKLIDWELE